MPPRFWIGACLAGFLLITPAGAGEVYFSSTHVLEKEIRAALVQVRSHVDLAVYDFTNKTLMKALSERARSGVLVRILIDADHYKPARFAELRHARVEIRMLRGKTRGRGLMHHKFAVLDDDVVLTGSANWTNGASFANYDNLLKLTEPQIVSGYRDEFSRLWAIASPVGLSN